MEFNEDYRYNPVGLAKPNNIARSRPFLIVVARKSFSSSYILSWLQGGYYEM